MNDDIADNSRQGRYHYYNSKREAESVARQYTKYLFAATKCGSCAVWVIKEEWFTFLFYRSRITVHVYGIRRNSGVEKSDFCFTTADIISAISRKISEKKKMAKNFSRYGWNLKLDFKASIYGIRSGAIPHCSVSKSRKKF